MQQAITKRRVTPRIGVYLAIFTSSLLSLMFMLLIVERLGTASDTVRSVMIFAPIGLYLVVALLAYATNATEYFAAGRSVPALLNGLAMAITALGGVGIVTLTGLFFFLGHDAFAFAIGWMLGLMVLGILLAPYLRKYGAATVPSYLGRRFASRTVRQASALLLLPAIFCIMAAEVRIVAVLLQQFAGQPLAETVAFGAILLFCMVSVGGMYGLTWANCAQAITVLCGLLIPLVIVSLKLTNLPFPQMTYGLVFDRLGLREASNDIIATPDATTPLLQLPGVMPETISKPFVEAFGAVSATNFVLIALVVMAGIATMPALLARSGTTRGVYDMRKSMGWTVLVVGLVMLSLPALAVFFRFFLFDSVIGATEAEIPAWLRRLQLAGVVSLNDAGAVLTVEAVQLARDGIFGAFAIAADLPGAVVYLGLAAALAATVAAISAHGLAAANIMTDDLALGADPLPTSTLARLVLARMFVSLALVGGGVLALQLPVDPLHLFCWGLSLSAATLFPCLVMSIWWKRINAQGALLGMVTGFAATLGFIVLYRLGLAPTTFGNDDLIAAVFGLPLAVVVTVVVSLAGPVPQHALLEFVRDLRIPGGETIVDREVRLSRNRTR
ncbi:MAG: sodium:solute symporter [Pseudomonadota bacterium]